MFKYPIIPKDCSAETLFPDAIAHPSFMDEEPDYYAEINMGFGTLMTPVWAVTLDPLEHIERRSDGTFDHDYWICLCKWMDGSPVTIRYYKSQVHYQEYSMPEYLKRRTL